MATPIALVTGANRGIGFEVARQLAARGLQVVIGARNGERGGDAARELADEGYAVSALLLDVADADSVDAAARALTADQGRLDVLVNNAGISLDHSQPPSRLDPALLRETFETNVFGAFGVTRAFAPLLRASPAGRIVFLSSSLGSLTQIQDPDSPYYSVVAPAYQASKCTVNALTVLFARELHDDGVKVNAACPGWVRTELGGRDAPRSVEQGADTPVWLATLGADGPTGGLFRDRAPIPW